MDTRITAIMQKHVVSVAMDDTIETVEGILIEHHLSSAPVMDPVKGDCFGIISSSDIVRFHAAKRNPKAVRAWEICTYKPIEVGPNLTVTEAARLLVKHGIHHLVVIAEDETIVGFVSTLDIIEKCFLQDAPRL